MLSPLTSTPPCPCPQVSSRTEIIGAIVRCTEETPFCGCTRVQFSSGDIIPGNSSEMWQRGFEEDITKYGILSISAMDLPLTWNNPTKIWLQIGYAMGGKLPGFSTMCTAMWIYLVAGNKEYQNRRSYIQNLRSYQGLSIALSAYGWMTNCLLALDVYYAFPAVQILISVALIK